MYTYQRKLKTNLLKNSAAFQKEMEFVGIYMRMIISTAFAPCNRRYVVTESVLDDTIHVHRYNKVDVPEQRKGLVAAGEGCCRSGNGVWDARGGQCRFMHTECIPTHSDASHAWTIDLWPK